MGNTNISTSLSALASALLVFLILSMSTNTAQASFCVAHNFGVYSPEMDKQVSGSDPQVLGQEYCTEYLTGTQSCGSAPVGGGSVCQGTGTCRQYDDSNLGCANFTFTSFACETQGDTMPFDSFDKGCACSNPSFEAVNDPVNGTVGCVSIDTSSEGTGCMVMPGIPTKVGNPCSVATGNKFQTEADFSFNGLKYSRYYNSLNLVNLGLGKGWQHGYQKRLIITGNTLKVISSSGRGEVWTNVGGNWQGDADSKVMVSENGSDFLLTRANGKTETYSATGSLLTEVSSKGETTTYTYTVDGALEKVTNHYGLEISFTYQDGVLISVTDPLAQVYRYEYDANDNLTAVVYPDSTASDSDNPRRTYHYEDATFPNHLTGITDENGDRYSTYGYDGTGFAILTEYAATTNVSGQEKFTLNKGANNTTTVTDAAGTQEVWTFQEILGAQRLLTKVNQTDGKNITQTWDANGNLLTLTDEEGRVTAYTYNSHNQRISTTEAFGTPSARTTSYEYVNADTDLVTKTISPSIAAGNVKETINTYDGDLNITSVVVDGFNAQGAAVQRSTSFVHDASGKVTAIDGPRTDVNDITTFEYYDCNTGAECGQLKTVTNALGHTTTYDAYDAAARLLQSTDANGTVTSYTYHVRGWLTSITQTPTAGVARVTTYEYDDVGQLVKALNPDGSEQYYVYDVAHDLIEVSDNLGNKARYVYDAKGNRTDETILDSNNTLVRSVATQYDHRNFITQINNGGSVTQLVNDAVGNVSSQTDPNINATGHTYDSLDRLTTTVDALTNNSGYQYDVADQLSQVTAPNGAVTQYEYDDLGNQTKEISADRGTILYTHDDAGNVISMTDARGVVTSYSYDVLNRLTAISYPTPSENISYTYDSLACPMGIGRLCTVEDDSGLETYQYDAWGNVLRQDKTERNSAGVDIGTYTTKYYYDAANRVVEIQYPSQRSVYITRDVIGRLTAVAMKAPGGVMTQLITNRTYRADGLWVEQTYGNGLVQTKDYDTQGRLTDNATASGTRDYLYDANGNIVNIESAGNSLDIDYGYDALDRLTSQSDTINNLVQGYGYDENSNRLSSSAPLQNSTLVYENNSNRLESINGSTLTVDASGKTLTDTAGRAYLYNDAGRISQISVANTVVGSYTYNSQQLRTQKHSGADTTLYHYDLAGMLIAESDVSNTLKDYVYADGELITVIELNHNIDLIVPADVVVEATAILTPVILGNATAQDINGVPLTATVNDSGPFPLGQTSVVWSASDGIGNTEQVTQSITVQDTIAPIITAPNDVVGSVQAAGLTTPIALGSPTVNDIFDVLVTNDSPGVFGVGQHTVTWTATDSSGNASQATQLVDVSIPSSLPSVTNGLCNPFTDAAGVVSSTVCDSDMLTGLSFSAATWQEMDLGSTIQGNRLSISLKNTDFASSQNDALDAMQSLKVLASTTAHGNLSYAQYVQQVGVVEYDLTANAPFTELDYTVNGAQLTVYYRSDITIEIPGFMRYLRLYNVDANGASPVLIQEVLVRPIYSGEPGYVTPSDPNDVMIDQSQLCPAQVNLAPSGTASQSTDYSSSYLANRGINGTTTDFTATAKTDSNASWQVALPQFSQAEQIVLHNRDNCCQHRLRDITVTIDDEQGVEVFQSPLLNVENQLSGPSTITVDLPAGLNAGTVKVSRLTDPDLSGGGTWASDANILSLGEVVVLGCTVTPPIIPSVTQPSAQTAFTDMAFSFLVEAADFSGAALNYVANGLPTGLTINAATGHISGTPTQVGSYSVNVVVANSGASSIVSFQIDVLDGTAGCAQPSNISGLGVASQSSDFSASYAASKANNGILTDFSVTASLDDSASWQLDFAQQQDIQTIRVHNRDDCCHARLRDVVVSLEDDQGVELYRTGALNQENILAGPSWIDVGVPANTFASTIRILRLSDPDFSGGGSNTSDSNVLTLGEVEVFSCSASGGQ